MMLQRQGTTCQHRDIRQHRGWIDPCCGIDKPRVSTGQGRLARISRVWSHTMLFGAKRIALTAIVASGLLCDAAMAQTPFYQTSDVEIAGRRLDGG
jgi:hypothetical protein